MWDAIERIVYLVLFPALLFGAIVRIPIAPGSALPLAGSGLAVIALGVLLSYGLRLWPGVDARLHASGAQTAFRFNSYVALALADRLAGAPGVAWTALIIAICVPVANVAAVWPLARQGGHGYLRELLRNPLILATVAGLLFNLLGLRLPALADITVARIGAAALPLGLMAVGAGLQLGALKEGPRLAAALAGHTPRAAASLCGAAGGGSGPATRAASSGRRLRCAAHRFQRLCAGRAHGRARRATRPGW